MQSNCPICDRGYPLDIIKELPVTWLTMPAHEVVGYVCLVSKTHVVELHDLDEAAGAAFMRDVQTVSRALASATGAIKLNYEIHGNTVPHLHMHFYPRYTARQEPLALRDIRDRLAALIT